MDSQALKSFIEIEDAGWRRLVAGFGQSGTEIAENAEMGRQGLASDLQALDRL